MTQSIDGFSQTAHRKLTPLNGHDFDGQEPHAELRAAFDIEWYIAQYSEAIFNLAQRNETPFEFYLRIGARMGHDPNPGFSEILYRINNPDVYQHLLLNPNDSGYRHYLKYGQAEPGRCIPTQAAIELARKISKALDIQFLQESHLTKTPGDSILFYSGIRT